MPLVFGLLVVFNAVFLAWQFFEQQNRAQNSIVVVEEQQGKRIQLLAERADLLATLNPSAETSDESVFPQMKEDQTSCYRVGPFIDSGLVKQVRKTFEKSGFDVKVVTINSESSRYWVYIPPLNSAEKAQVVLAELQKGGVDGSVVTDPQFANAISLGNVASLDAAEALKTRLMDLGFRAESKSISSTRDEQWLLLLNIGNVAKTQVDRILVGSPKIRREAAPCQ